MTYYSCIWFLCDLMENKAVEKVISSKFHDKLKSVLRILDDRRITSNGTFERM